MISEFLNQSKIWLTELNLMVVPDGNCLKVHRSELERNGFVADEILTELRSVISKKLFWSGKDDDWLYLETF